ncbi:P-loop containing nucleoside triphosphate hydrolase protein [Aspergillus ambiguus]|uniref:sulfotransferase family protein n=1 Tax=Aspergillus ambiguus TaxID=176160 RepID=UPI003CCE2B0A
MDFLLEKIFTVPEPPPRVRTKPMQVICVGLSRSATESLRVALAQLGLTPYHGWDVSYEENIGYIQGWVQLLRRKWIGSPDGDVHISAKDFDALLGHADAVVETPAWFFAAEMIKAYPDAKVILNHRRDLDAWHRSALRTLVQEVEEKWSIHILRRLGASFFWQWKYFYQYGFILGFRSPIPGKLGPGLACNGKWVYRDHCNMIRGLVPKDRLLEWSADEGWEPLCEFLGKPRPAEDFPSTNAVSSFQARVDDQVRQQAVKAFWNFLMFTASVGALIAAVGLGLKSWRL